MTPERKAWWDSLPKEEKRVRLAIKKFETDIKWRKKHFNGGLFYTSDQQKSYIAMGKHTIKALRKQIAMRTWERKDVHSIHCPCCWTWIYANDYKPPCCDRCGQKLRWD